MDLFKAPGWSLLLPGIWHWFNGHIERGFAWSLAIVFSAPFVLPAIVLWCLCWVDARRLAARQSNPSFQ
jgi:hypothetical protein